MSMSIVPNYHDLILKKCLRFCSFWRWFRVLSGQHQNRFEKKTVSLSLSFTAFPILDLPCPAEDAKANVTVLDLKAVYEKGQSRRKANSEQRLLNADVNLTATSQKQIQVDIHNNRAKEKQQENGKPHSLALFFLESTMPALNFIGW